MALERDQRPAMARRQDVLLDRRLEMIAMGSNNPVRIVRGFDKFRRHWIAGDPQLHRLIVRGISHTKNFSAGIGRIAVLPTAFRSTVLRVS